MVIPGGDTYEVAERREDLPDTPMITQTSMASAISVVSMGRIPYDGFTLPVCSVGSEEQYVATQSGSRPTLDMLLGRNTSAGGDAGVTIYRCQEGAAPEEIRSHIGRVMLGRNGNQDGCLVERLNPDGSRWIGLAPWDGGDISWLVRNANVNAFGWINKDGSLVYSSRATDEERFQLVVRMSDSDVWILEEDLPYSWLHPTLTPSGKHLFALRLGDGFADLAWGGVDGESDFKATVELHRTSDRVDALRAWRTLSGTSGNAGVTESQLTWFSSELRRLVLWTPSSRTTTLFPEGTLAASPDGESGRWLITSETDLELAAVLKTTVATSLVFDDPWTARPGTDGDAIIMLASGLEIELARLQTREFESTDGLSIPSAEPGDVTTVPKTPRGDPRRD